MATAQEIASQSNCPVCEGTSLFESMEITILSNILTELGEPMTQADINAAASCFVCLGMSLAEAQILVLLNALAVATGGGTGSGGATVGNASPEGVVVGNPGALYVDITNHTFWIKETGVGANGWVQYV